MKTLISLVLTRSRLSAYRTPTVIGQLACLSAFRTPTVIGLSSAADGRRLRDGRGRHRLSRVRPCCWAMCRCGPRPRAGPDSEARGLSSPRPCKHGQTCDGGGQMRFRRACRPSPGPRQRLALRTRPTNRPRAAPPWRISSATAATRSRGRAGGGHRFARVLLSRVTGVGPA